MSESYLGAIYKNWRIDTHYPEYTRFLGCFELASEHHRDTGGSDVYYCEEYAYPQSIDPDNHFIEFIKQSVSPLPITNIQFAKSWWIDYPKHSYAGVHAHQPGRQLTAVVFLTTTNNYVESPHHGNLFTLHSKNDNMLYNDYPTIAGNVHILDGTIWHGTYPTLDNRKVFVCDFTYDI